MKRSLPIFFIYVCLLTFFPFFLAAKKPDKLYFHGKPELPDSILTNVIFFAPFYKDIIEEYEADMYVKGKMHVGRQNHLIRIVPSMFHLDKHVKDYIVESVNELNYTAPDIHDLKVKAVSGTIPKYRGNMKEIQEYFKVNVYSSSLLSDKLVSPLAKNAPKYYRYYLDSVMGSGANMRYRILIRPKNKSAQLVKGYMVVNDQTWTLREISLDGKFELLKFRIKIRMGEKGKEEFLPSRIDVDVFFRFLWNKLDASYMALYDYKDIRLNDAYRKHEKQKKKKNKYNLTESFRLTCEPKAFLSDSVSFPRLRPYPLTPGEKKIYQDYAARADTTLANTRPKKRSKVFIGQVGDILLNSYTIDFPNLGSVRASPLINPLLLSYSHNNGFSYRQEFKYNRIFAGDRLLRIFPRIGYNFTRKEFYWNVNGNFQYWPKKRASLHLSAGNGNRIYNSQILDVLKQIPDSVLDFRQIHMDVFKDLYFSVSHNVEVINGLNISVGFTAHRRTPVRKSKFVTLTPPTHGQIAIVNSLHDVYISFAPRVKMEWTPGLYYYMSGNRKVNLYSKYPTFSFDYERGIKGVFKSTGSYERIEVDAQQRIRLGLMRSLYWRAGAGAFTNQNEMYFVDFVNFTRSNLPEGWNDDIGGVFQLLDGNWYNSSREYLRMHLTYEAPFLLLRHLIKYTNWVLNERIYFNLLAIKKLTPYMEVGYGIGTNVFDAGVFTSWERGKFGTVGCKFTFELFNK